jgi:hypothetical protein
VGVGSGKRKTRESASDGLWKLSFSAVAIPIAGWFTVLLVTRLRARMEWMETLQALSVSAISMLCIPLHGLVLMAFSSFGRGFAELAGEVPWRTIAGVIATAAPVFVAIVTSNLVLGNGELSIVQVSIGAVSAHVALLCVLPLCGRADAR